MDAGSVHPYARAAASAGAAPRSSARSEGKMHPIWAAAEEAKVARPLGDFSVRDSAHQRKLQALMGTEAAAPRRREVINDEQQAADWAATAAEEAERDRAEAVAKAREAAATAMRRDEGADVDAEGYQHAPEAPAFRDGYNSTLRVMPAQPDHLHNGLKPVDARGQAAGQVEADVLRPMHARTAMRPEQGPVSLPARVDGAATAPALYNDTLATTSSRPERNALQFAPRVAETAAVAGLRSRDSVHRLLSTRDDLVAAVGRGFLKMLAQDVLAPALQPQHVQTANREGPVLRLRGSGAAAAPGVAAGRSLTAPALDGMRVQGQIELLLRALEAPEQAPADLPRDMSGVEDSRRAETMAAALGKAFMEIGLTLPYSGKATEGPRRNDSVALALGLRALEADGVFGSRTTTMEVPESLRREVAVAIGRAMLHLQAAAGMEASRSAAAPTLDSDGRDRTLKDAVGRLTLQLLETSAGKAPDEVQRQAARREVLMRLIGQGMVSSAQAAVSFAGTETDRDRLEAAPLARAGGVQPAVIPMATAAKAVEVVRQNHPREAVNARALLPLVPTHEVRPKRVAQLRKDAQAQVREDAPALPLPLPQALADPVVATRKPATAQPVMPPSPAPASTTAVPVSKAPVRSSPRLASGSVQAAQQAALAERMTTGLLVTKPQPSKGLVRRTVPPRLSAAKMPMQHNPVGMAAGAGAAQHAVQRYEAVL